MKLKSADKAVFFLAAGLFVLLYIAVKAGQPAQAKWWIVGLCGCGVMLYANHGGAKKFKKTVQVFVELFKRRNQ